MSERPRHAVSLSAGYSSDLGGSAGVTWSDRNVRGNGEQLNLSATVINLGGTAATRHRLRHERQVHHPGVRASRPVAAVRRGCHQAVAAGVRSDGGNIRRGAEPQDIEPLERKRRRLRGPRDRSPRKASRTSTRLFALPLGVLYDSTDLASPLLDPTHGLRASLSLAPTLSRGQPNATFFVTQASIAHYLDLGRVFRADPGRSVLALRAIAASAIGAHAMSMESVDGRQVSRSRSAPRSALLRRRQRHGARLSLSIRRTAVPRRQPGRRHRDDRTQRRVPPAHRHQLRRGGLRRRR